MMRFILSALLLVGLLGADAPATVKLSPGWATFGQVLPAGVTKTGLQVPGLETQTDVKCRWADGSIKFAVVTTFVPATAAGGGGTYGLVPTDGTATVNGIPRASVRFTIAGVTYRATLPATASKADLWLDGSLCRESRYRLTPTDSTGAEHPFLRVLIDLRVYRDLSARLDVTVENTLNKAGAGVVSYGVEVVDETDPAKPVSLWRKDSVSHAWLCRWRKTFGLNGLDEAEINPDVEPLFQSKAVPRFQPTITNVILNAEGNPLFDILGPGNLNTYMGDVGARAELAPLPDWTARALVYRDLAQFDFLRLAGNLGGSWPIHLREPDGSNFTIDAHPNFWLDARADPGDRPLGTMGGTTLRPETNHTPSLAFVPYLITGDRYYADEAAFWANYALYGTYQNKYQNGRGGSAGWLISNQVRGIGWCLRNLADAAAWLPDADPLRPYFAQKTVNNLKKLDEMAAAEPSPIGASWLGKRPENATNAGVYVSTWEHHILAWAICHTQKQGFNGGDGELKRIVGFQLSLFTAGAAYPREYAAPYRLQVGDRDKPGGAVTKLYTSLGDVFKASYGTKPNPPQPFAGYYGLDARLMLQIAVEKGWNAEQAQAALDWLNPQITADGNKRAGWYITPEAK